MRRFSQRPAAKGGSSEIFFWKATEKEKHVALKVTASPVLRGGFARGPHRYRFSQ